MSPYTIVRDLYDRTIRPVLPRRWIVNNGVPTRTARIFDRTRHRPDCKEGSVQALRRYVRPDDHVVVIGGGDGVTAVVAARRCERVTVFEAAGEMVDVVEETAHINRMADRITVEHAAVGPTINAYGEHIGDLRDPADIPPCDVLEMDCEGAEDEILAGLDQRPRVVIVETHPQHGCTKAVIRDHLERMDYTPMSVCPESSPDVVVGLRGDDRPTTASADR